MPDPDRRAVAGLHRTIPALPVRDVSAAVAYYRDRFGFDARYEAGDFAVMARDDAVICIGTMSGTHQGELLGVPASGRRVDWRMCHVMKFGPDGRATEHSAIRDDLGLMRQMGAL